MTTAGYYNSGKRLEEGKHYQFQVVSQITLQDERSYFILEDPYKIRHLLPSWLYENYKIVTGLSISCKVDKINCTGRVYLEPEHPHYSEGHIYSFNIVRIEKKSRSNKLSLIVTDIFNNEILVDCPNGYSSENFESIESDKVTCKLVRIRKGLPVLVLCRNQSVVANYKT
jgi:hypothetical protein